MSRIFSLIFIVFLLTFSNSFAASDNIYLVEDVTAEVPGKSPSAARAIATNSARRDAFLILLSRLGLNIDVADHITNDEISDMVRSEQIDNERISGSNYSATFNIMFAKDFVDHILSKKSSAPQSNLTETLKIEIPKSEESQLLIPVQVSRNELLIWEESNYWKKALQKNLSQKSQQKFVIPNADMENLAILNAENIKVIEYSGLEPMLSKYHADSVYILLFNYDTIYNKVNVEAVYIRRLQKKRVKLSFVNVDLLSHEALMNKVAEKTLDYLKNALTPENKTLNSNLVHINIPITNLQQWLELKGKIENSNVVNQLNIESISKDQVSILVNYLDATVNIEEAFLKAGMSLTKNSENSYTLTP